MGRYDHIDFTPPQGVRDACLRGVALHEGGVTGDGIEPETVEWARKLARGVAITPSKARKMARFFGRNQRFQSEPKDSPAWASWQLWGGHAGDAWSEKLVTQMDAADEATKAAESPAEASTTAADLNAPTPLADAAEARAVPYEAHPIHEGAWDADAAVKRLRSWAGVDGDDPGEEAWRKYEKGFAVVRGAGDKLGDFALPHQDVVNGRLVTVPAGVSAAIGALNGARGEMSLPESVRTAALKHLEQHREAAQKRESADVGGGVVTMRGEGAEILCRDANVGHKTWVQVARYGSFEGHPQGPFRFDPQTFAEIVRNFRSTQNQHVQVDFEHASELHPENVATEGVPALAWVVDLDDRGDAGLWGLFEWVDPRAVEYVRANQYRYVSPAVQFGAIDKVTGKPIGARLTSVALTNHPFLDGMAPVTASERKTPEAPTTARFGVSPSDVHIPALTGANTNTKAKKMDPNESPDGAAEMADLKGAKDALVKLQREHAMLADKHSAMCKSLREMADVGPETAEDEALAKIGALVEKMKAAQKAEAEQMADRAIAGHGLSEKAREKLVAHAMRDAADFIDTYPKAVKVETPAAPATMSEQRPAAPAVDSQTRALFSTQVAGNNTTPAPIATGDGTVADVSKAREEIAASLMRDGKAKTYPQAVMMADDQMTAETRKRAVAPFAH
jgi:phage I-like protein